MLLHFDLVSMYKAIHALYLFDRNKAAIINAILCIIQVIPQVISI
jgi:hypothetical protein